MKDMGLLEMLTDILYYPFKTNLYNLENLADIPEQMFKIM